MSYAVRNDGAGWRAVDGPQDCTEGEFWQGEQPDIPPVSDVPAVVSRFQARAAMMQAGILDDAEAAVAQADAITRLAWAEATEFRRASPAVAALAATMGLSSAQLDDLFRAAAQIEA